MASFVEILAQKKASYGETATKINETKAKIDASRNRLDELKNDREATRPSFNAEGDVIITEQEFHEINTLKALKGLLKLESCDVTRVD